MKDVISRFALTLRAGALKYMSFFDVVIKKYAEEQAIIVCFFCISIG